MIPVRETLLLSAVLFLACGDDPLQRMIKQPKLKPFEGAMESPPPGTVPLERELGSIELLSGRIAASPDAGYAEAIPIALDRAALERGKKRFEIICATCHGLTGDGQSIVARNMSLRPPPSLHAFAGRPPGFFFTVISEGFGLMPSYAADLSVRERWEVVGYVRALQRSQKASLADAPAEERQRLETTRGEEGR
jgi:mono/diheme cytochrome c family protein